MAMSACTVIETKFTTLTPKKYYFHIGSVESLEEKLTKAQSSIHPESWVEVQYINRTNWTITLIQIIPYLVVMGVVLYGFTQAAGPLQRGGPGSNIFSIGKSNARKIKKEDITVTFADVAGCDEAKKEIMEFLYEFSLSS